MTNMGTGMLLVTLCRRRETRPAGLEAQFRLVGATPNGEEQTFSTRMQPDLLLYMPLSTIAAGNPTSGTDRENEHTRQQKPGYPQ